MPRKIIEHPTTLVRYSVTQAVYDSIYDALGFAIIGDEPDPPANAAPETYAAVDDAGAWDEGPTYTFEMEGGDRYATTLANFMHRYRPLGAAVVNIERPDLLSFLTDAEGNHLTTANGRRLGGL